MNNEQISSVFAEKLNTKAAQIHAQNTMVALTEWRVMIENYINEFHNCSDKFKEQDLLLSPMRTEFAKDKLIVGLGLDRVYKRIQNTPETIKMINVMNKGKNLILVFRQALTGQQINTIFYIQGKYGEIYEAPEEILKERNFLVQSLTAYGSKNFLNPFSLTYSIEESFSQNINDLIAEGVVNQINTEDSHYWNLIKNVKEMSGVKSMLFTAEDAEIYQLLIQEKAQDLTRRRYWNLVKSMGGGGGHRPAYAQIGDSGLKQIKFIGLNSQAAHLRYQLLEKQLQKLVSSLNEMSSTLKDELLKIYTIQNQSTLTSKIDKNVNRIARKSIEDIFKGKKELPSPNIILNI